MFQYLPHVKFGTQIVAGLGVSKIVADIVQNNVPILTTFQKVTVRTGTFVLGSMLIDQSSKHIVEQIDLVAEWIENRKGN